MISRMRNFAGYREYPKYLMMRHYWIVKQAMLEEAAKLVETGVIGRPDDIYFLSFEEFREGVRAGPLDHDLIDQRRSEFEACERLTPPRVITSEGEVLAGAYQNARVPSWRPGRHPGLRWDGRRPGADDPELGRRLTWRRATFWSRRSPTRAGRRCS